MGIQYSFEIHAWLVCDFLKVIS